MKKELPQDLRNAIFCEWITTSASLVFRALGKKSKCSKLLEEKLFHDFYGITETVLDIYKRSHFPRLSDLRPKARPAFFELAEFVESLDCRDCQYFLDALENFKNKDQVY